MKTHPTLLLALLLIVGSANIKAQTDTITFHADYKRNVIKWNMTPFLLWSSNNINLSYERVLKPHRSFSVNAGYFELPSFGNYDSLRMDAARKKGGFSVSGDYRFYFKKRNTAFAPDGLYWGPYGSFYNYGFTNSFTVGDNTSSSGTLILDGHFNIINAGVQLGYQFVIKEKFTVDLIFMGPSVSLYNAKLSVEGDIDIDQEDEYLEAVRDMLISKFPFLDELIEKKEFGTNGVTTSIGPGLRYMIQVGYRF